MATVQSLVENHTFRIDQSTFVSTGDKVRIAGHFYSDKPPFPSIIAAAVYLPLYHFGLSLDNGPNIAYYVITLLTVKLAFLAALWCFFKALRYTGLANDHRLYLTFALGAGSLLFAWSTTFNNHSLAASFLTMGFYFLLRTRFEAAHGRYFLLSGLCFALAGVCDIPTGIFHVLFAGYLITLSTSKRNIILFAVPLILTVAAYMAHNAMISGSIMPFQINPEFFAYEGSAFAQPGDLSGTSPNHPLAALAYGIRCLFGKNGFVLYNPLLLIAVPLLVREILLKRGFWREACLVLAGSIIIMAYYFVMTNNFGGWSFSIRWFVPLLPMVFFFLYPCFENARPKINLFTVLLCASLLISVVGAVGPWSNKSVSDTSLLANLSRMKVIAVSLF